MSLHPCMAWRGGPAFWVAWVYVAIVSEQTIASVSDHVMGGLAHGVASYRSRRCN